MLKIEYKSADELIPYGNNPRNNDNAVEYVANSIKEFGFRQPIVVDNDNVIVAGHTRLKAAKLLGISSVPCVSTEDLTEEQVKAYRLADNKVSEFAGWDFILLEKELDELELDMEDFGFVNQEFDPAHFDDLFEDAPPKEEAEPEKIQCPHCGEWFDA